MPNNLGSGVSRVLNPDNTEYVEVVWQQGKPPMDAELNLLQELGINYTRKALLRGTPSGWLGNDTNSSAVYSTNRQWSNWFQFGKQRTGEQKSVLWAVVNGWLLPITGTRTGTPPGAPDDTDTWNLVALDPPPSNAGDFRVDYVFLEVWQARIPPNPSTLNKPSVSGVYRYGNVEGGYSFIPDDLVDPALGFETTQRVQLQYRIRVVKGLVGFTGYPDGFDPATVKAQGGAAAPTSWTYQNMRQVLGDPGLWRAGDGTANTLGTVDGYVYAVPIAAVFRRNNIIWAGDPSQNLNGGFDRNPTAVDRTGVLTFASPTLVSDLSASALLLTLSSASNIPLPLTPLTDVTIRIGDEYLTYSSITTGGAMTLTARGANGSRAEAHKAGTTVEVIAGRPDGLFADQVAATDILDLRHVVSPNGFDYQTLLEENLDRLLRGQLRSNWKRSGAGPQGPFVFYEDKITNGAAALGVTKLDGPDNLRQIFSDAAVLQKIELIAKPTAAAAPVAVGDAWTYTLSVNMTTKVSVGAVFGAGDALTVPVAQLKGGIPGGDADQVRWAYDGDAGNLSVRLDGQTDPIDPSFYTVSPLNPGPTDDLVITLGAGFPTTSQRLYITAHCLFGPGRGLARRPDSLHSVDVEFPSTDLLLNQQEVATNVFRVQVKALSLWSKYQNSMVLDRLPVTAEAYAELGSKTLVLQPLRRVDLPDAVTTMDGTAANPRPTGFLSGLGNTSGSQLEASPTDFGVAGVVVGDALILTGGAQPGRYTVTALATTSTPDDTLVLDRAVPTAAGVGYVVCHAQGLMPLLKRDGLTAKWTTTDPLGLFSGTTEVTAATKNIYVSFPRSLIPGWGEYDLPMLWDDQAPFSQGINYLLNIPSGALPLPAAQRNYTPTSFSGGVSYATFSTVDLNPPYTNALPYNTAVPGVFGKTYAGIRKFTDTRGLGRQGLELPPFYGIARVWAVYEAGDYRLNNSAVDASTRAATGSGSAAKNLLRQSCSEPIFWIEKDEDGDSTFILNAAALDLTKSPTPIANFAAGNFVIEASIYGFDRDAFDSTKEFRLVLSRQRGEAIAVGRATNLNAAIVSPELIVPSTFTNSDEVLANYSRTPYQGDAWGSQTLYQDVGYAAGPLQSGDVVALTGSQLDQNALTRPNQKGLEILAETGFTTTLGTGRIGPSFGSGASPSNAGYEDKSAAWPPTSPVAARPPIKLGALTGSNLGSAGTAYLGCTERLPLGALYRDKDFRGNRFKATAPTGIVFHRDVYRNQLMSWSDTSSLEQTEAALSGAEGAGKRGDFVVHVDGNQGNYSLLTNFRVNRGGSLFMGSGQTPGSEVSALYPTELLAPVGADTTQVNVLVGRAYLVRNAVTNVGLTEVSAGNELMLLIQTTAYSLPSAVTPETWFTALNTNGLLEGNSAADLYRIEGRPLVNDFRRVSVDPGSITLTRRTLTYRT